MSTAGRPTFSAAVGKSKTSTIRTQLESNKDQVAHTKLKFRQVGQNSTTEIKLKDFKAELEENERKFAPNKDHSALWLTKAEEKVEVKLLIKDTPSSSSSVNPAQTFDDSDVSINSSKSSFSSSDEESFGSDSDDEEDDDELLQAELERIKEERAISNAKKEQEKKEMDEKFRKEAALSSNPLIMNPEGDAKIKRRWNDDVVFRNQAMNEREPKKRFINDTVRSDFHRSFLKKYVK